MAGVKSEDYNSQFNSVAAARAAAAEDCQENQAELIMSRGGEHKKPIIVNSMALMQTGVPVDNSTPSSSI